LWKTGNVVRQNCNSTVVALHSLYCRISTVCFSRSPWPFKQFSPSTTITIARCQYLRKWKKICLLI